MNLEDMFHEMTPAERKRFEARFEETKRRIREAFYGKPTMDDILRRQREVRVLRPARDKLRPAHVGKEEG